MNKEIVIDVSSDGRVSALHMDEFPLSFLGNMKIERASTIEFSEQQQSFYIKVSPERSPTQKVLADFIPHEVRGFKGYDEARQFEVEWLQECSKLDIDPLSNEGVSVARRLRSEMQQSSTVA